jgi:hypothetical protein
MASKGAARAGVPVTQVRKLGGECVKINGMDVWLFFWEEGILKAIIIAYDTRLRHYRR